MDALSQSGQGKNSPVQYPPCCYLGVEASHVSISALRSLRSAIAFAIGPSSSKRNVDLTFECTSCAKDLDPIAHILYERIAALRRMMAKHIGKEAMIRLRIKRI